MPAAPQSAAQAQSSAPKRSTAPGPGSTAANLVKQERSPASLVGPKWQTAKPASRLSRSYTNTVSLSAHAAIVRVSPRRSPGQISSVSPKEPTLPQRVAKFDPTSAPSSSAAAKAAVCSAENRPQT